MENITIKQICDFLKNPDLTNFAMLNEINEQSFPILIEKDFVALKQSVQVIQETGNINEMKVMELNNITKEEVRMLLKIMNYYKNMDKIEYFNMDKIEYFSNQPVTLDGCEKEADERNGRHFYLTDFLLFLNTNTFNNEVENLKEQIKKEIDTDIFIELQENALEKIAKITDADLIKYPRFGKNNIFSKNFLTIQSHVEKAVNKIKTAFKPLVQKIQENTNWQQRIEKNTLAKQNCLNELESINLLLQKRLHDLITTYPLNSKIVDITLNIKDAENVDLSFTSTLENDGGTEVANLTELFKYFCNLHFEVSELDEFYTALNYETNNEIFSILKNNIIEKDPVLALKFTYNVANTFENYPKKNNIPLICIAVVEKQDENQYYFTNKFCGLHYPIMDQLKNLCELGLLPKSFSLKRNGFYPAVNHGNIAETLEDISLLYKEETICSNEYDSSKPYYFANVFNIANGSITKLLCQQLGIEEFNGHINARYGSSVLFSKQIKNTNATKNIEMNIVDFLAHLMTQAIDKQSTLNHNDCISTETNIEEKNANMETIVNPNEYYKSFERNKAILLQEIADEKKNEKLIQEITIKENEHQQFNDGNEGKLENFIKHLNNKEPIAKHLDLQKPHTLIGKVEYKEYKESKNLQIKPNEIKTRQIQPKL